ncbi:MAG: glycerol-3-phosphate dehydrogenase [Rhodobiaceae bacterium]|nr:MAG: glycerol-3-phosphate dehydrogenase [Rhodobiaceae bacterium]
MQRNLDTMSKTSYDLIVIGGGISGATIAWDASLRGLKVALLEKNDFAHATTAGSSKLIHGGLRYLVNGEIGLVRESLRERRTWEQNAPHLVDPLPFILPTYGRGIKGSLILAIGLTMYDLLAYDRNRLDDPDKKLPAYRSISRDEVLKLMPSLQKEGLTGAKIYYDCQMFAPERLCLEFILGAVEKGTDAANYAKVTGFVKEAGEAGRSEIKGVVVQDTLTGETHTIKGALTINAAGPWADITMGHAEKDGKPSKRLIRSKGIHLITRDLSGEYAMAVQSKLGGHFFVLPWRGKTILGTTDTVFEGDPDKVGVTEKDIEDFLAVVNDGLPGLGLTRSDVEHYYVGIRPLVDTTPQDDTDDADSYNASRAAEIVDHSKIDNLDGFISAMGGKWTTSRHLAEKVVDSALKKLGRKVSSSTEETPLYGGKTGRFRPFVEAAIAKHSDMPAKVIENLTRYHGARYEQVLATANERQGEAPELLQPLSENTVDLGAQVVHAVRHEMAMTLSDAVLRRLGLGTLGHPGMDAINQAADLMARELGWDAQTRARQIETLEEKYKTVETEV